MNSGGRPHWQFTAKQYEEIEAMAIFHASDREIAHEFGTSERSFGVMKNNDPEILKRITIGRSKGTRLLRTKQFQIALQGNVSMLIYLGTVVLGQVPGAAFQTGFGAQDPMAMADGEAPELSQAAKQHLYELASAICRIALAANRQDQLTNGDRNIPAVEANSD